MPRMSKEQKKELAFLALEAVFNQASFMKSGYTFSMGQRIIEPINNRELRKKTWE